MTDPKEVADLVARLRAICDPTSEALPDGTRLTMFVRAGDAAATTLETLSSELERVKGERDEALLLFEQGKAMDEQAMETGLSVSCIDHAIMRARAERAEASLGVAETALKNLLTLNGTHSPFGGEIYRDRVDRAWDAARSALASIQATGE